MEWIPITKPSITNLEISYVNDAITNGWGGKCNDYIYKFENSFADYLGSKHCLATSCCTGAIHLALLSTGIQAGDEVIVPDITWIASVEPILYIGAKPVFVDILEDSWCIDPSKIESSITHKTKAIIVVHLYGNLVEMDEILSIANKYNLVVIEDAAEGLGSEYKGKKAGSIGDIGVFSFHGTKTITTGEGGMLVTNNPEYYERAAILNHHGQDPKANKMFWMKEYGYKYKMSNLQAALGCAQIERADELVDKKREIFNWYKEAFIGTEEITLNPEPVYTKNSYWMPTIIINKKKDFNSEDFMKYLKKNKIDSRPFFYPLSSLPMFKEMKENKVAYKIYKKGINLPCAFHLKKEDIDRICKCIIDYNY